ncbi:uncharacterized protein LOC132607856 [Lycium barbarum]|uniref:uncharacterized protein LOC132607856 n=1 Tax=Lycium barbarum TaxID=112863 RepID=UPI00293E1BCD|nr:uncharacterized protein LOC132607856 [Lycium barbarum]
MIIAIWNVRGFNKRFKHKEFSRIVNKERITVIVVTKHRVAKQREPKIMKQLLPNWRWHDNYDHNNRGMIWLAWDPSKVDLVMLHVHPQFLHCTLKDLTNALVFEFTVVYGKHTIIDRQPLWQDLEGMDVKIQLSWSIMGDFNVILGEEDRIGGRQVQDVEVMDSNKLLDNTGLTIMNSVGRFFPWTNSHVHNRIDRALVNSVWMNIWPQVEVEVKDPQFSDHALLSVTIGPVQRQGAKPFRFLNHLCKHKKIMSIVQETSEKLVHNTSMARVWTKLKPTKEVMKSLNIHEFSIEENRIQDTRQQLQETQEKLIVIFNNPSLFAQEKVLKHELEKWIMVEESILKQKSRVLWLKLGDSNLTYFHANIKSRIAQNHITRLVSATGELLTTNLEIENEAIGFYVNLLGTCAEQFPEIDPRVMTSGKILHRNQQVQLITPVTREDVNGAL